MSIAKNLFSPKLWDEKYEKINFAIIPPKDQTRIFIEKFIGKGDGSVFEVGCFPGQYLAVFGELGYTLNGIDITKRAKDDLPHWLTSKNYKVGNIQHGDFHTMNEKEQYDIVCSFGFIEHFENWQDEILQHARLVKNGGKLLITAPNFKTCLPGLLHKIFDKQNYLRHYIPSMDPFKWADVISPLDFEIKFVGYFGKFQFWVEYQGKPWPYQIAKIFISISNKILSPIINFFSKSNKNSPFCGLIAKKI
jgi:SAM-dependent methyltransferase